jgi:hypothetical protein
MKGAELTLKVNEVVSGKCSVAWAEAQVAMEGLRTLNAVPDCLDLRKTGGVIRFVIPKAAEAPAAPKLTAESVAAMTAEEKAAALMLLQAAAQA